MLRDIEKHPVLFVLTAQLGFVLFATHPEDALGTPEGIAEHNLSLHRHSASENLSIPGHKPGWVPKVPNMLTLFA